MSAAQYQLEVWDRTNTFRRGIFAGPLDPGCERTWKLGGEETFTCTVSARDPAAAYLVGGAVLRLQRVGVAAEFDLYRLSPEGGRHYDEDGQVIRLTGDALWSDLAQGRVAQAQSDGRRLYVFGLTGYTPLAWIQFLLPFYAGNSLTFAVGVAEPTAGVDLMFESPTSPIAALRMLEAATRCELQFRYDATGHTCYVELLQRVGAASGGAELREGKNLAAISLVDGEATATRLYGRGAGMLSLADAQWIVAAVAGTAGARVLSFATKSPVFEDGAYTTMGGTTQKYFWVAGKGAYPISASAASAGTLTVVQGALAIPAAGDVGFISTDVPGTRLDYLESPSALVAYGVRVGEDMVADDVGDATNLVAGGSYTGTYVGGLAPGLTLIGTPTVSEVSVAALPSNSQYATEGGQAQRVVATEGQGYTHAAITVPTGSTLRPYLGLRFGVTVISGRVRVELRHSNGSAYPLERTLAQEGVGVHLDITCGPVHDQPLPAGTLTPAVVAHGGPAEWVSDYLMVTPQVGQEVPAYVASYGAWLLFDRMASALLDAATPKREWQLDVADLFRLDPDRFVYERLGRGDTVKIRHSRFAPESQRIVEIADNPATGKVSRLALAASARARAPQETDAYMPAYGARRPGPYPLLPIPDRAGVLGWGARFDVSDGKLYIWAVGNAMTASLQLFTKGTRGAAYPGAATAVLASRQGEFGGIAVTTGAAVFYKIVALDGTAAAGTAQEDAYSRSDGAPPTVEPRREFTDATRSAANVFARLDSRQAERVRLAVKDSEASGGTVWRLVVSGVSSAALFVNAGTEVDGSTAWFHDGSATFAQKLKAIALARESIQRVYLQGEAENTGLKSTWVPLPLEASQLAQVQSADLSWDDAGSQLVATAAGGTFCQSVRFDIDDDPNFSVPISITEGWAQSLVDGARVTVHAPLVAADRNKQWYLRLTPYNGPLASGLPSGSAASPVRSSVAVPGPATNNLQCLAKVTGSTATTVTLTVTNSAGGTVTLVAITGSATLFSGAAVGTPVASGSVWVLNRGAFAAGSGSAEFLGTASGYVSDTTYAPVEEQGRDTVGLLAAAAMQSTSAVSVVARVFVADPFPGGTITITYTSTGTGTITPASGQTISGGSVTADITTTGYVDFTIARGYGVGIGRVRFTASAAGRMQSTDAFDVTQSSVPPPVCSVRRSNVSASTRTTAYVLLDALLGSGDSGLEYRWRTDTSTGVGSWSAWTVSSGGTALPREIGTTRERLFARMIHMEARGAAGFVGTAYAEISPGMNFMDDDGLGLSTGVSGSSTFSAGASGNRYTVARHYESVQAKDGTTVTFAAAYSAVPFYQVRQGKGTAPTSGNKVDMRLTTLTTSTATVKAVQISGSTSTAYTEYFAITLNGTENSLGITLGEMVEAFSSLDNSNSTSTGYTVTYTVNAVTLDPADFLYVNIYYNNGPSSTSWTLARQRIYQTGFNSTDTMTFTASLGANFDIRMLTYTMNGSTFSAVAKKVEFAAITGGTESSLTLGTDDYVTIDTWEVP